MNKFGESIAADKITADLLMDSIDVINKHEWISEKIKELATLWNLCDYREQQLFLKELLLRFQTLDAKEERKATKHVNQFLKEEKLLPGTAIFVGCGDVNDNTDGSISALTRMKHMLDPVGEWEDHIYGNMNELKTKIKNNMTILIFDDFIGTGNKIIKKYNWLKEVIDEELDVDINTITICFLSHAAMMFSIDRLQNETNCKISVYMHLEQGISGQYPVDEVDKKIKLMGVLEEKLSDTFGKKALEDYKLGYSGSESLYFAENTNCPNNIFPIFWWKQLRSGQKHETLLHRSK